MSTHEKIQELRDRKARLHQGGGAKRLEKQHAKGKLGARERISFLVDPETFGETHLFARHRCTDFGMDGKDLPADGVITGCGIVGGRQVYVASQDFTVSGGSVGEVHADKIVSAMKMSLECGSPFIMINDSGGARIQESVDALSGYGRIFFHNVLLSGVVPQISIIAGPCAGGAAYSPALADFVIMVKGTGKMFITGPQVIKNVTGEDIDAEQLGGHLAQMNHSGVVHFTADSDQDALDLCKRLLSFLPANNMEDPPDFGGGEIVYTDDDTLNYLIPDDPREAYDVKQVIAAIIDDGDFLEIQDHYAPNAVVGLARFNGRTAGIVANQPMEKAGVLDIDASDKISRFVRFCNAFNIPLVTLVDVPGFMPGIDQEYGGIIRHGAKMLFAFSAATVPMITVILRKAYGGAYLAMCGKDLGADRVAAWPTSEIAVMGAEGAVDVIFRKELAQAEDKATARKEFIAQYRAQFATPYFAAGRNIVDDIIEPKETRRYLSFALESLRNKRETRPRKKHGLIPL